MTKRLRYLIRQVGLPPVRLHDLRHGAASLAHTAGADLKTVQDQLGHASIVLTADTYTSVLPAAQHRAAEATARLVLAAARGARAKMTGRHQPDGVTRPPGRSITTTPDSRPGGGQPAGQSTSMRDYLFNLIYDLSPARLGRGGRWGCSHSRLSTVDGVTLIWRAPRRSPRTRSGSRAPLCVKWCAQVDVVDL